MEFFVDSADTELIKKAYSMGLCDGCTTNPSLIKQAGKDHKKVVQEISSLIPGPISVEALSETAEGMVKEGEEYITWGKNIVVKIPMCPEGMKAVKILSKKKIRTNVTLIFSPLQALIAAKAGATYVSPFVGRLDDIGHVGMDIIAQIKDIFVQYDFETKILAASIRHPTHVLEAALIGADVATVPPDILFKLSNHPLTDSGMKKFLEDSKAWKK
ncbi:MAG: fructose-6-phosphate aldolase [Nanoarchaeota archaeon]|nr:fructose-6-phosphate aldolase [Nanoarchaeota archaeon]